MKKYLFLLLLNVTLLSLNSQTRLIEGELTKKEKKMHPTSFDVTHNDDIITYASNKNERLISHYKKDLSLIKEKKLGNSVKGDLKEIIIKNDTLNLINYFFDKNENKIVFYRYYGSLNDLELKEEEILVLDDKTIKSYFGISFGSVFSQKKLKDLESYGFDQIFTSKNKNFFSIIIDIKDKSVQKNKIFTFDSSFNLIQQAGFEKDVKDKLVDIQGIFVDDKNGSTFLVSKNYHNNTRKDEYKKKVNYHFEIVKFSKGNTNSINLETNNLYVNDLKFFENSDDLHLIGYYSDFKDWAQQGIYIVEIDRNSLSIKLNKQIKFDEEYIKSAYQDNMLLSRNNNYLEFYRIQEFYFSNNSFFLFSEVINTTIMSNGYIKTQYGNVAMQKLDRNLNLIKSEILKRDTATKCSYLRAKDKFIIYFYGFKKTNKKGDIYKSINNRSKLLELIIDKDFIIIEKETDELLFDWRRYLNVNEDYTLFFSLLKKEKRIYKLILE